jgi:hypothetical protein
MAADELVVVRPSLAGLTARSGATDSVATVECASLPEALAAMVVFDGAEGARANRAEMVAAAGEVLSVDVERAGDGSAVARWEGGELAGADLPERLGAQGRGLLTVLIGRDAGCGPAEVEAWARAGDPGVEVEAHDAGLADPVLLIGAE